MLMEPQGEEITTGCQVKVILRDWQAKEEHLEVLIVPDEAADYAHGFLGQNTPLAKALLGEKAGTVIPYLKDDIYSIEILSVTRSDTPPPKDAALKRQAALKQVQREVQDANAIVFASSFSGKWGDYDPDSIPKDKKTEDQK